VSRGGEYEDQSHHCHDAGEFRRSGNRHWLASQCQCPTATHHPSARAQHSGDNDPLTTPATSVLPPGQEPYPPQGQPYQGQPYQGQGGYRGGDPSYTSQGNCQDLANREQDIRGRLNEAPPSGQQHDRLVYQLGQVRSQLQRCR